jgi:hypothetical protein
MLSKLYHDYKGAPVDLDKLQHVISLYFHQKYGVASISPIKAGGTLGVFFQAELSGRPIFIKTHLPGQSYLDNLKKESQIMGILYDKILWMDVTELSYGEGVQFVFAMDFLDPLDSLPDQSQIQNLIDTYQISFAQKGKSDIVGLYQFKEIKSQCDTAIHELFSAGLITPQIYQSCLEPIAAFKSIKQDNILCHGDLSNKNIMQKDGKLIVIDWEDSFLGSANYDFYYWLTFFDQRKYWSNNFLINTQEGLEGFAIMLSVTIVKCYLSYLSGTYKEHAVSINDRIMELLRMDPRNG